MRRIHARAMSRRIDHLSQVATFALCIVIICSLGGYVLGSVLHALIA